MKNKTLLKNRYNYYLRGNLVLNQSKNQVNKIQQEINQQNQEL